MRKTLLALVALVSLSAQAVAAQHAPSQHQAAAASHSAYAGQESRDIKSLSADEVKGLLAGQGLGYAKAAELNGYPGPMHVLELAEALELSAQQRASTQSLMQRHKAEARDLGAKLVAAETQLDRAFKDKHIDEKRLAELTAEIGQLQAALRTAHLSTHLQQTALLTAHQVRRYNALRGYAADAHSHGKH